jgi:hypothetical protein
VAKHSGANVASFVCARPHPMPPRAGRKAAAQVEAVRVLVESWDRGGNAREAALASDGLGAVLEWIWY